jgi:nitroreductase
MDKCNEACCLKSEPAGDGETPGEKQSCGGFLDLARRRFSVRKYHERPVDRRQIDYILEAARVAPTAVNYQPFRIIVVDSSEGMRKLAAGAMTNGAPLAFIVCADTEKAFRRPMDGKSMSDIDASIITDHMMLAATDQGLGTLWMTYFDPKIIREEFNIPEKLEPLNILLAGHSALEAASPKRHDRMRLRMEELVVEGSF